MLTGDIYRYAMFGGFGEYMDRIVERIEREAGIPGLVSILAEHRTSSQTRLLTEPEAVQSRVRLISLRST